MSDPIPSVALALQGGGSHGAFTWGVLDRLLHEVASGRLRIAAVSGASAGAINAALTVTGLVQGGAEAARQKLADFWKMLSRRGFLAGNPLFFGEPGPFGFNPMGFNIDWSPVPILLEAADLVISPYTNVFYSDALAPLLDAAFPAAELARLNQATEPRLFINATDVRNTRRTIFTQPDVSVVSLRASACLPTDFKAVTIDGLPFWDGGYLGNPALSPLIDHAQDLLVVLLNPLHRDGMPPTSARGIQDRLNEITFNASVVLEINAIEAVNRLLAEVQAAGIQHKSRYKPVHLHLIRDDAYLASLGFVSKNSTSWSLLSSLHDAGYATAEAWIGKHLGDLGKRSSCDVKAELTHPVLTASLPST